MARALTAPVYETAGWRDAAACAGSPVVFVTTAEGKHPDETRAKALCAVCPSVDPCLQWAIDNEEHGVWGGTNEAERARISPRQRTRRREPRTPEAAAVRAVLADAQWHHRRELIGAVLEVLTDDRARHFASASGRATRVDPTTDVRTVAAGVAVSNTLSSLAKHDIVDKNGQFVRWIR